MTAREKGFLLLSSHLGDPERKVLTTAQLRTLAQRVRSSAIAAEDRELTPRDLVALGYGQPMADRIAALLSEKDLLEHYIRLGARAGCIPICRGSETYPRILRHRLGLDSPGCLWAKGDTALLNRPAISLVGSRELRQENRVFAETVGRHAAASGMVLISGNARGADRTAQNSCLEAGGQVISIVAEPMNLQPYRQNVLFLSEEEYDAGFSAQRALSRNRCIHAMGQMVFVAQSERKRGGTWSGTQQNLRHGWSPVLCFRDGSPAVQELEQLGAYAIGVDEIANFNTLPEESFRLF